MIEILLTSFPFVLRVWYLKARGIPVNLYNVHHALLLWAVLAMVAFFAVFYYHPKSYTGIVPFRAVPVVSENTGTVTRVYVEGGQHVKAGDLLFTVDDRTERAAVDAARRKVEELDHQVTTAEMSVKAAQAGVDAAQAALVQANLALTDQRSLQARGSAAFQKSALERAESTRAARRAELTAAQTQLDTAKFQVLSVLPAQMLSAKAALRQAEVELAKTETRAVTDGTVEQMTTAVGARAAAAAIAPAMIIVPDRKEPLRVVAGFNQVSRRELFEGMAAEVACESNFSINMENTVLPARITRIQDTVAPGMIAPSSKLIEPKERARRGEVVVHLELVHPEHQDLLVPGSGCTVQAYTTHTKGYWEGTIVGHAVEMMGVIKAVGLRVRAWFGLASGIGLAGGGH